MNEEKPHITCDIKSEWTGWLNCVRRLQSCAHNQEGLAIAQLTVLLSQDGTPVLWTSPKITKLEPKRRITAEQIQALVDLFGDDILSMLQEAM